MGSFYLGLTLLLFYSFSLNICQALVYLLIRPFSWKRARSIQKWLENAWLAAITSIFHPKHRILLSGDLPRAEDKHVVMISNHQLDVDWVILWAIAHYYGRSGDVKIVLKADLKWIPILGWPGMQGFGFIFLKRNWAEDKESLHRQLAAASRESRSWLVIFPEGTTVAAETRTSSMAFAKKTDRPALDKLLLPRVKGFKAVLENWSGKEALLYDFTMLYEGYRGEIPTWEMGYSRNEDTGLPNLGKLLAGAPGVKRNVYCHMHRMKLSDCVENFDEGSVTKFLDDKWLEKEAIVQGFAKSGEMPSEFVPQDETVIEGSLKRMMLLWAIDAVVLTLLGWAVKTSFFN